MAERQREGGGVGDWGQFRSAWPRRAAWHGVRPRGGMRTTRASWRKHGNSADEEVEGEAAQRGRVLSAKTNQGFYRRLDRYLLCRKHLDCVTVCPVLIAVRVGLGRIRKCADIDGRGGRATSTSCGRTQCRGPRVERRASSNPLAVVRDVAVRVPAAAVDSLGFAGSRAGGCRGEVAKHDVFRVRSARATGAEGRALDWRAVVDRRGFACKRELLVVCWQQRSDTAVW